MSQLPDRDLRAINRSLTAIRRKGYSRPIRQGLEDGVIQPGRSVHDHGCGRGDDIERLGREGYEVSGWDPNHRPHGKKTIADIVNLGFVINVIENPIERASTVTEAFSLTKLALVIGVRNKISAKNKIIYGDGEYIPNSSTFQKPYSNDELQNYIERLLRRRLYIAASGIGYVFKDETVRQEYLASRGRKRTPSG